MLWGILTEISLQGLHANTVKALLDLGVNFDQSYRLHFAKFRTTQLCDFIVKRFQIITVLRHLKSPVMLINKLFQVEIYSKYDYIDNADNRKNEARKIEIRKSKSIISNFFQKTLEESQPTVR
jgi:hypothetical protein